MNLMDWIPCYAQYEYFFEVPTLLSWRGEKSGKANWTKCSELLAGAVAFCFRLFIRSDVTRKHKPIDVPLALKSRSLSVLHSDKGCEIIFPNSGGA
jgi:hypothetical protein